MRVLFNSWRDTDHPKAGGSELVVDQYATGLHQRGHDVHLRAGEAKDAPHPYSLSSGGGTYSQYLLSPFHHLRGGREADVIVDIVNGMGFYSPLFADKPVVAMIHHIHDEQWPMFYGPLVAKFGSFQEHELLPLAYRNSLIITGTSSIHDELVAMGFHRDRLRHVPYQPEMSEASLDSGTQGSLSEHDEPLFVAAGRLAAGKRIDLLLQLWEKVRPHTGGRLVIIGDGPDRAALEAQASEGVEFTGFISEQAKSDLFADAWALVHSAAREGWGMVISEAGLAGTPSLGFNVPGVREAIRDGESGLLASSEEQFIASWVALASDAQLRSRLGAEARSFAKSLLAVDQIGLVEEVLEEAVSLHQQRRGPATWSLGTKHLNQRADVATTPASTVTSDWPMPEDSGEKVGPSLSIVIPAFNEATRLPPLLQTLPEYVDVEQTEVILVDDGSSDATAEVAERYLDRYPNSQVLSLEVNRGKGAALRTGVAATRGSRVVFMDADMATDLRDLATVLAALGDHAIAIGSRVSAGSEVSSGSRHRRVMGIGFNWMIRQLTPLGLTDTQCGFKAFRGPEAKVLFHLSEEDGFAQDVEILSLAANMGLSIAEVPVRWTEVPGSKVHPVADSVRTAVDLVHRRVRGNHQAVITGLTIEGLSADMAVAAKEVAQLVRTTDATFAGDGVVHVLLPGARWSTVPDIGARLADRVGGSYAGRWSVDARGVVDTTDTHGIFGEPADALA